MHSIELVQQPGTSQIQICTLIVHYPTLKETVRYRVEISRDSENRLVEVKVGTFGSGSVILIPLHFELLAACLREGLLDNNETGLVTFDAYKEAAGVKH